MKKEFKRAIDLVNATAPGRNAMSRRIAALQLSGYKVQYMGIMWNFGRVGSHRFTEHGLIIQLEAAKGRRTRSGHHVNACPVYLVTKAK